MSLITAGLIFIARTANDLLFDRSTQRVQKTAYRETGKAIRQANRKGHYINGAKLYRENLNRNDNREKFISEL